MLVNLSNIYSKLRGDRSGQRNEDAAQGFVRSTTKYWVRSEDISTIKHAILQRLPVFKFNADESFGDSQMTNSVYLDNSSLELYHGRLDKRANAIAVRLRWYGMKEPPAIVFVERKTHREGWKGEESVKERFQLPEDKVVPFLEGDYKLEEAVNDLRAKGKSEEEVEMFAELFQEVQEQVDSKQLKPMIRTQYMRSAFQIPFDASVRISLDTNLVMIKENPDGGPSTSLMGRWYRDPDIPITRTEITRFPHAVLEVKLSLKEGEGAPLWVQDLLESGMVTEVHKFSKFIQGTATLFPDMVQAVPYWVDDETLRPSMLMSAPSPRESDLVNSIPSPMMRLDLDSSREERPREIPRFRGPALEDLRHPLLGDEPTMDLIGEQNYLRDKCAQKRGGGNVHSYLTRLFGLDKPKRVVGPRQAMRVEPKTFFANERTFLSWLNMAITVGSIAIALLGFSGTASKNPNRMVVIELIEIISMILLVVGLIISLYAVTLFMWRSRKIARKQVAYFDDRIGPLGLCVVVMGALFSIFCIGLYDYIKDLSETGAG